MTESTPKQVAEDRIARAKAAEVPTLYLNGFQTGLTNADVVVVGECNGEPVTLLNMSFTTAKTLALALTNTISMLEIKSDREMLTTYEFDSFMKEESE